MDVTQVARTLVRVSIEGSHDDLIPKAKSGALLILLPRVQRTLAGVMHYWIIALWRVWCSFLAGTGLETSWLVTPS